MFGIDTGLNDTLFCCLKNSNIKKSAFSNLILNRFRKESNDNNNRFFITKTMGLAKSEFNYTH